MHTLRPCGNVYAIEIRQSSLVRDVAYSRIVWLTTRIWSALAGPPSSSCACPIEDFNEIAHRASKSLGEPNEHREAGYLHPSFEVADERFVRLAAIGELLLGKAARRAEHAK